IGLLFSVGFNFIILFVTDPTILFISYSLSGFGYGLTYNSLIGIALEPYEPKEREMSMAIFQTFFAIGIYYGDKVYGLILNLIPASYSTQQMYQSVFLVILVMTLVTLFSVVFLLKEKGENQL
ncbi:MAG: MFS transporter, partial [Erysipelothrix sp.]|nr:MFS transporter [Erysipelothrix sp.]